MISNLLLDCWLSLVAAMLRLFCPNRRTLKKKKLNKTNNLIQYKIYHLQRFQKQGERFKTSFKSFGYHFFIELSPYLVSLIRRCNKNCF